MPPCYLCFTISTQIGTTDPNTNPSAIEDLAESVSFSEIHKKTMQTKFCAVLCETIIGKDTLLNYGGLILPFGGMILFLTFSPTADTTISTSLPKEIRLALRSHKTLFSQGGVLLIVTSYVAASPAFIF